MGDLKCGELEDELKFKCNGFNKGNNFSIYVLFNLKKVPMQASIILSAGLFIACLDQMKEDEMNNGRRTLQTICMTLPIIKL